MIAQFIYCSHCITPEIHGFVPHLPFPQTLWRFSHFMVMERSVSEPWTRTFRTSSAYALSIILTLLSWGECGHFSGNSVCHYKLTSTNQGTSSSYKCMQEVWRARSVRVVQSVVPQSLNRLSSQGWSKEKAERKKIEKRGGPMPEPPPHCNHFTLISHFLLVPSSHRHFHLRPFHRLDVQLKANSTSFFNALQTACQFIT